MKTMTLIGIGLLLTGCGTNRREALRTMDGLLEKSRYADCQTIRVYLDQIHIAVKAELNK